MFKTVIYSFYLSCGSELARQGTSLNFVIVVSLLLPIARKFGLYLAPIKSGLRRIVSEGSVIAKLATKVFPAD